MLLSFSMGEANRLEDWPSKYLLKKGIAKRGKELKVFVQYKQGGGVRVAGCCKTQEYLMVVRDCRAYGDMCDTTICRLPADDRDDG